MSKHVIEPHTAHLENISEAFRKAIAYEEERIKTLKVLEHGTCDEASRHWKSMLPPHEKSIARIQTLVTMFDGAESVAITHSTD